MELRRLQLDHFRNYPALDLALGAGLHVFSGANAQGKTNLLEAVYLTAVGKSPRTSQEGELIAFDADVSRVAAEYASTRRGPVQVEVALGRRGTTSAQKRIKVNGTARGQADLAGIAPVVLFLVDDLEIIRGEPARRRAFLDTDLAAMSRTYGWALRQYTRVVEQRNKLLKGIRDGEANPAELAPWDAQLISFGARVLEVRARFVADLNAVSGDTYSGLTASAQRMTLEYRCEWADLGDEEPTRETFAARLDAALTELAAEELRRGSSLVGPHRDDLTILVDGRDVRQFGSQGEQRTAALALRVSEFSLLQRLFAEPPILLLDDILSELDRTRRAALLAHLAPLAQVILTTTDVDALGLPPHTDVHLYHVDHGTVSTL
jgi:DNA replication and repair protein RecF